MQKLFKTLLLTFYFKSCSYVFLSIDDVGFLVVRVA